MRIRLLLLIGIRRGGFIYNFENFSEKIFERTGNFSEWCKTKKSLFARESDFRLLWQTGFQSLRWKASSRGAAQHGCETIFVEPTAVVETCIAAGEGMGSASPSRLPETGKFTR